jgi:hypothetical protein
VSEGAARERLRIYVDTSVIGGCLDPEFAAFSELLFDHFRAGDHVLVTSDLTAAELEFAPEAVRKVVASVPPGNRKVVTTSAEAKRLAELYIAAGVLPKWCWSDAQHIAVATLADVDVVVSWNFKHIVNLQRIRGYNAVNAGLGYQQLEIRTPREVLENGN